MLHGLSIASCHEACWHQKLFFSSLAANVPGLSMKFVLGLAGAVSRRVQAHLAAAAAIAAAAAQPTGVPCDSDAPDDAQARAKQLDAQACAANHPAFSAPHNRLGAFSATVVPTAVRIHSNHSMLPPPVGLLASPAKCGLGSYAIPFAIKLVAAC